MDTKSAQGRRRHGGRCQRLHLDSRSWSQINAARAEDHHRGNAGDRPYPLIVCCAGRKWARPGLLPSCMSPEFQRVDTDLNQPGRWQCSDLIQHRLGRTILPLFHLSR